MSINSTLIRAHLKYYEANATAIKVKHDVNDTQTYFILGIVVLYSILIVASLVSNPFLIYVLLVRRKTQIKLIDIFVANLSLSDLFLTIFNIPLSLIIYFSDEWPFSSILCQIATYSTSCSIYVNILTMAYISIDRYFAITSPFNPNPNGYRKKSILLDDSMRRKIYSALTLIWIIALILSLPQLLFTKVPMSKYKMADRVGVLANLTDELGDYEEMSFVKEEEADYSGELSEDPFRKCLMSYPIENMKTYMIFVNFSLQYLIPLIVIFYFYGKIIYHLYLNLNIAELMESPSSHQLTKTHSSSQLQKNKLSIDEPKLSKTDKKLLASTPALLVCSTHSINKKRSSVNVKLQTNTKAKSEGFNRTRNLKKSIKVMIIIIALFLLSWLPIHLYRLITTYVPLIHNYFDSSASGPGTSEPMITAGNHTLNVIDLLASCKNNTSQQTCIDAVNEAIKDMKVYGEADAKSYSLHNPYVFFISYFMSMSSVCYNPIVYFWMHKKFRAEAKQVFSKIFRLGFLIRSRFRFASLRNQTSSSKASGVKMIDSSSKSTCSRTSSSKKRHGSNCSEQAKCKLIKRVSLKVRSQNTTAKRLHSI